MKNHLLLLSVFLSFIWTGSVFGQGSTTSALSGVVLDVNEEPLIGATVILTHMPTGVDYGSITDIDGRFRLLNLDAGGPYQVSITFVGYESYAKNDIYLKLGETFGLNAVMYEGAESLEEIVVLAEKDGGAQSSGQGSNIDAETIDKLPTVNRDLTDYTRMDPRASLRLSSNGNSVSFSGINNRYNAIYIDGAVNNDLFGLSQSGTNGGQVGISPISPDAIDEIQIAVAPYDVTLGGFAGGAINAVTRSGTNEFEGSLYYLFRNQSLAGKTPTEDESVDRTKLPDFTARTYGARIGGPIIKNKLFFFANVELQRDETPYVLPLDQYNGSSSIETLDAIRQKLIDDYNYDPGDFRGFTTKLDGEKIVAKINWNINNFHKLVLRHSYVNGESTGSLTSNPSNVSYANRAVFFPSTTNSSALELKSRFGNDKSNKLIVGYTAVTDDREVTGQPFPNIVITDGGATLDLGSDPFAYSNIVKQNTLSITDNFTLYKNRHTITIGTHNEFYDIDNTFLPLHPSRYTYSSVDKFFADEAFLYLYGHTVGNVEIGDNAKSAAAVFKASQWAFYVQDEFNMTDRLKLTGGLRLDIPVFNDDAPLINEDFNTTTIALLEQEGWDLKGARASILPETQVLFNPRFGFDYDLDEERSMKLSGGIGIFTSRVPFVWPAGVYLRNGLASGFTANFDGRGFGPAGSGGIAFNPDVNNQPFNDNNPSGDVDIFAEDFKYPQVLKTSITLEKNFTSGLYAMLSTQYNKTLNNLLITNVNLPSQPRGTLTGTPDNRPVFSTDVIDPTYGNISLMHNTSEGYTWTFTAQLMKQFAFGLTTSLAYNFTKAESVYDGNSFINSNNWKGFHGINGRNFQEDSQISTFDAGSRITGLVAYSKQFKNTRTSISLFYNGQSGSRYSYVYNDEGRLNGDNPLDDDTRNLIYIPRTSADIVLVDQDFDGNGSISANETAAGQWEALDAFIEGDDYLSENRGGYAERNGARTPFENIIDLKVEESFFVTTSSGRKHEVKLSLDIFNFTNFLSKDWGRRHEVGDLGNYRILDYQGNIEGTETPTFTFSAPTTGDPWTIVDFGVNSSRWQAQFGVRYSF